MTLLQSHQKQMWRPRRASSHWSYLPHQALPQIFHSENCPSFLLIRALSGVHQSSPLNQKHHPKGKLVKVGHQGPHQSPSKEPLDSAAVPNNISEAFLECHSGGSASR